MNKQSTLDPNLTAEPKALNEGLVTLLLGISIVLVVMNTMMFNLALPDITMAYQLSPSSSFWIVTGYSIIFAISSITYSRLSDFIPIRRLFIIGILSLSLTAIVGLGAVGIASYLCSFATLFPLPQILVVQYQLSAIEAGLVIFPGSLLAMLVSRRVGRIIDAHGNDAIIRYIPLLILAAVILFALFESTSYLSIMFIYMLLSIGFTFLTSSISNEMSRILLPSLVMNPLKGELSE